MKLILVESPTKIKTLEKFLGKEYKVLASMGHIRDLPKNKLGIDIEKNFEPNYIIPTKARKNVNSLKKEVKKADLVYLGTDPDREGEAISYHLLEALDLKEYKRITFHEITEESIKESLQNPHSIDMALVDAQQARRVLDRLVGYKLSPLLWKKIAKGLSAGRVQSAALHIITSREEEISAFKSEEYWTINVNLLCKEGEMEVVLKKKNDKTIEKPGLKEVEKVKIEEDLQKASFQIIFVEKKEKKRHPLPPFTTSTMQQEAFKRMNYPSRFTMSIAQKLYEKGLITYHRTDSLHLSSQAKKQAQKYIEEKIGKDYHKERNFSAKGRTQEAHEAIRPSDPLREPSSLKKEEARLYDLIWRRFLATQMKEAVFYSTTVSVEAKSENNYLLSASGSTLKFPGFTKIYPMKFEEKELVKVEKGEKPKLDRINPEQHFTKPPARFTEGTLIKKMEKHGIGRPSTYAPTLSTLFNRNYIEKVDKKYLKPTEVGTIVSKFLAEHFPFITDLDFTAKMEENLDEIASGNKEWKKLIEYFYDDFAEKLKNKEKEIKKEDIMEEKTEEKCDKCGANMAIKLGKYGKFLACTNFPECKNTKPLEGEEEEEEKTCDKCNAKMQLKKSRFGQFYGCSNYPECKNIKGVGEEDLNITCPNCKKGKVVQKKSKRGAFYACDQYPECTFTSNQKPSPEKA